jgi:hypothetical protein
MAVCILSKVNVFQKLLSDCDRQEVDFVTDTEPVPTFDSDAYGCELTRNLEQGREVLTENNRNGLM